jgi:hypothetical protein
MDTKPACAGWCASLGQDIVGLKPSAMDTKLGTQRVPGGLTEYMDLPPVI